MAIIKCTALLRLGTGDGDLTLAASRLAGWSESWYYEGSFAGADNQWRNGSPNWCSLRARLLPRGAFVVGQRYQQVDGNGLPQGGAAVQASVFPGSTGLVCDAPSQSLLVAYAGPDNLNTRRWAIRGLPDARQSAGEYVPSLPFANALTALNDFIRLNFLFRAVNHSFPKSKITGVDALGTVTTLTDHGLAPGQDVFLSRLTNVATGRSFSTIAVVNTVPTARSFTVVPTLATTVYRGGTARRRGFLYSTVGSYATERTITRKVGRPSAEYVGRAKRASR